MGNFSPDPKFVAQTPGFAELTQERKSQRMNRRPKVDPMTIPAMAPPSRGALEFAAAAAKVVVGTVAKVVVVAWRGRNLDISSGSVREG